MKPLFKHNTAKKLICLALICLIMISFFPFRAYASSTKYVYNITTLKQNKFVTSKDYSYKYNEKTNTETYTYDLYKITLPGYGYVRIETKSVRDLYIYKAINTKKDPYYSESILNLYGKRVYREVLPKGTYYIRADKWVKFKWNYCYAKWGTNYCRSKAVPLSSGKKRIEIFHYGREYDRWFKVSLPQKKTITITYSAENYYTDFYIYNSRGYSVDNSKLTDTSWRTVLLPKGTYYIRVYRDNDEDEDSFYYGRYLEFCWR